MLNFSNLETLNNYFYYSLLYLFNYNDTLNLSNWEKETVKLYNEYYNAEDNLIVDRKTYRNNYDQLNQIVQLVYCHGNPYSFHKKESPKKFNAQNFFDHNFNWKHYSAYFFIRRFNFFQYFPKQTTKDITILNYFEVPACFFPLYYSIASVFNSINQDWNKIKEKIIGKTFLFFYEFDKIGETGKIENFRKHINPFSEKSIFLLYECLLEHIWPNELYSLAGPAQKRSATLTYVSDFNLQLRRICDFYFIWQKDYSLFSKIKTDLETDNNLTDVQMGKYYNVYASITKKGEKKFNEQSKNIKQKELLKYMEQAQERELNTDDSILFQAKKIAETKYHKKFGL